MSHLVFFPPPALMAVTIYWTWRGGGRMVGGRGKEGADGGDHFEHF
jgi:hypothetical protein